MNFLSLSKAIFLVAIILTLVPLFAVIAFIFMLLLKFIGTVGIILLVGYVLYKLLTDDVHE